MFRGTCTRTHAQFVLRLGWTSVGWGGMGMLHVGMILMMSVWAGRHLQWQNSKTDQLETSVTLELLREAIAGIGKCPILGLLDITL